MVNRLPRRKVDRQLAPLNPTLGEIENGINEPTPVSRRSTALFGLGKHGFENAPLSISETGIVNRFFHRPDRAALSIERVDVQCVVKSYWRFYVSFVSEKRAITSGVFHGILNFQTGF